MTTSIPSVDFDAVFNLLQEFVPSERYEKTINAMSHVYSLFTNNDVSLTKYSKPTGVSSER